MMSLSSQSPEQPSSEERPGRIESGLTDQLIDPID
jgi:hypothetical protein